MVDKIYYAAILSVLTGLIVWAIKAYVGNVLISMTRELGHVKEGVDRVEDSLVKKTYELKIHFNETCVERQKACKAIVDHKIDSVSNRINKL